MQADRRRVLVLLKAESKHDHNIKYGEILFNDFDFDLILPVRQIRSLQFDGCH